MKSDVTYFDHISQRCPTAQRADKSTPTPVNSKRMAAPIHNIHKYTKLHRVHKSQYSCVWKGQDCLYQTGRCLEVNIVELANNVSGWQSCWGAAGSTRILFPLWLPISVWYPQSLLTTCFKEIFCLCVCVCEFGMSDGANYYNTHEP